MTIIIGSDVDGKRLKDLIKTYLVEKNFDVLDVTEGKELDFVDSTLAIAKEVQKNDDNLGIAIDAFGVGSFMTATKIKGMIAAEVSDERSAYMTRGHNNSKMITMGSEIVGDTLAKNVVKGFVNGHYDG
ncbi:galactose-6-phosphate isomerase subunit LacA [Staphylococcus warneri]|nr:galactose-6-phosphate isomerase subunit LacA [Staphylococcus warneri]MCI2789064.1 galactose-6-phosphate isomerase subunit LacA [Staphylococcus warneri]